MLAKELQQHGERCLNNRAATTLQERITLVKRLVGTNFQGYDEGRLRNLEWTVLQMLAPLCSPPRHFVPTEVAAIIKLVLQAKREIDELEQQRIGLTPGKPSPSEPLWKGVVGGNLIRPVSRPIPPTPPPTPTVFKPVARRPSTPSTPLEPMPEEVEWHETKACPVE